MYPVLPGRSTDQCSTLNFARRERCFGCGAAAGGGFDSSIPTNVLRVSRLRRSTTVEQVRAAFVIALQGAQDLLPTAVI